MKIVVCIRQGLDGELGPFDASAYEAALSVENAEVTLLTMASAASLDFLRGLTRLGAGRAILLSDKVFAGADTLCFSRLWVDGGEIRQDNQGKEIRPRQVEKYEYQTAFCRH